MLAMNESPTFIGLKGQSLLYAVTFCCSMGFLLFGYDIGYMGGLTTSTVFLEVFDNPNASLLAFLVSAYDLGALFGALFTFVVGDKSGRKANNIAGAIIVSVGAILQTTTFGLAQFLVGRILAGFGLGIMTTVIPIWLTECAMPKSRGRMMAMQLSNLIVGLIISNWLDYAMVSYAGSIQWRLPCAFQIVFCIIIVILTPFLPESPRYLCATDQVDRATVALAALRGGRIDTPEVVEEMNEIRYAIATEAQETGSWSDVFKDNGISGWTRVLIAFAANFFQQLSGVNVMSSLGPYIFQNSVGLSRHVSLLVSGGLQAFYFLSSLIPWLVVDRIGRRRLFMLGSTGMCLCMALSAILVGVGGKGPGYGAVVVLYLFQTFFTVGWQSNMWVYPSELLPLKLRLRGGALAVVSQWLFTFVVVEMTPPMITNIGYKTYVVFAVINFVTVPIVYLFFPETSQRPLEAVDLLFADQDGKRPSIFKVVRNSVDKDFVAKIDIQLQSQAKLRNKSEGLVGSAKESTVHIELAHDM
jgi:sugar porter (SP) family MFS transporter